jgi:hypothetical protein
MSDQMTIYDGVGTDPKTRVEMACMWAKQGYGTVDSRFLRLVRLCERACDRGEICIRRGDLYRMAQEEGLSVSVCREFRFDNNLWAPLSRYMLMFRPKLARCIHPKSADIDTIDLEAVWHAVVNPRTYFPAHSWKEAQRMTELKDVCA